MKDEDTSFSLATILADGEFYSGQKLGTLLGMGPSGISHHIQTLKKWGLDIFTVRGCGYRLASPLDLLNEEKILAFLLNKQAFIVPVVSSTNQYLLERLESLHQGDVCTAEYQYAGRGQRGRHWFSPFGENLYLSMYWKWEKNPDLMMGLSLTVGIVVAEALRKLGAEAVKVKWPNDLYVKDHKLGGILVETINNKAGASHIVIGVGINLRMRSVETSKIGQKWVNLRDIVDPGIDRSALVALLINGLRAHLPLFEEHGLRHFLTRWNRLDNFINRPVKLLAGDREIFGIARGIDLRGCLLLEQEGAMTSWSAGQVSLRAHPQ